MIFGHASIGYLMQGARVRKKIKIRAVPYRHGKFSTRAVPARKFYTVFPIVFFFDRMNRANRHNL